MTEAELKEAIFAMKLKGQDNVLFYDRKMVNERHLQNLAESWPEDSPVESLWIGIHVPPGKTLRACVLKRNPVIAKIVAIWERLTAPPEESEA